MILCPKCDRWTNGIICTQCGFKFVNNKIVSFVDCIDTEINYESQGLDRLYKYEQEHFWFKSRREFVKKVFIRYIKKESMIIEIGAGTGSISRMLLSEGYDNISVGEVHENGLIYAKSYGIKKLFQFNLVNTPFKEHFDVVCMFDVLEHIDNDDQALQNTLKIMKNDGYAILTVPAHMFLWSNIDKVSGHMRRYSKADLVLKMKKNGFKIVDCQYFFCFLTPLLLIRKKITKDSTETINEQLTGMKINSCLNSFLYLICYMENILNNIFHFPFGGSLIIVAKK